MIEHYSQGAFVNWICRSINVNTLQHSNFLWINKGYKQVKIGARLDPPHDRSKCLFRCDEHIYFFAVIWQLYIQHWTKLVGSKLRVVTRLNLLSNGSFPLVLFMLLNSQFSVFFFYVRQTLVLQHCVLQHQCVCKLYTDATRKFSEGVAFFPCVLPFPKPKKHDRCLQWIVFLEHADRKSTESICPLTESSSYLQWRHHHSTLALFACSCIVTDRKPDSANRCFIEQHCINPTLHPW